MDEAKSLEADRVGEALPHAIVVVHEVVAGSEDVRRIDAHADTLARLPSNALDDDGELLEARTDRGAASGGGFEQQLYASGHALERLGDGVGVAREPALAIVHVVARVRHERIELERLASL